MYVFTVSNTAPNHIYLNNDAYTGKSDRHWSNGGEK